RLFRPGVRRRRGSAFFIDAAMLNTSLDGVGTLDEDTLHLFVIEKPWTVDKLIDHARRQIIRQGASSTGLRPCYGAHLDSFLLMSAPSLEAARYRACAASGFDSQPLILLIAAPYRACICSRSFTRRCMVHPQPNKVCQAP